MSTLSENDAARLRFIERLHVMDMPGLTHLLAIEQTEELEELKRVATDEQWFEVAVRIRQEIERRTNQPAMTPPMQSNQQPEPSATPRTDAVTCTYYGRDKDGERLTTYLGVPAEEMAKLELELAATRLTLDKLGRVRAKEVWGVLEKDRAATIVTLSAELATARAALAKCEEEVKRGHREFEALQKMAAGFKAEALIQTAARRDEESWWKEKHDYQSRAVSAEAKLAQCEEKLAALEEANLSNYESARSATAAHAKALEDVKRMDWLETRLIGWGDHGTGNHAMYEINLELFAGETIRDAIDSALAATAAGPAAGGAK